MSRYRSGRAQISEKFMDEADLFAVRFNEGLVFLEVDSWEEVHFKPHDNIGSISSQDDAGYDSLKDPDRGDDEILFIPSGQLKVIHAGIGHSPSMLRRYTRYNEGQLQLRQLPNLTQTSARSGHDSGYIDGEMSPYQEPTDSEELLIVPDVSPHFDFFNPDQNRSHSPVLHISMRVYNVTPLFPDNNNDKKAIRRVVRPGSAPPIFNAGNIDKQINYKLESDWGVKPLPPSDVVNIRRGNDG